MITYRIKTSEVGDLVDSFCCHGYEWEIVRVGTAMPGVAAENVSLWGHCDNPKCTEGVYGEDDMYKGISNTSQLDLAFWLYERHVETEWYKYQDRNDIIYTTCVKCKRETVHSFLVTDDGNDVICQICGNVPICEHGDPF